MPNTKTIFIPGTKTKSVPIQDKLIPCQDLIFLFNQVNNLVNLTKRSSKSDNQGMLSFSRGQAPVVPAVCITKIMKKHTDFLILYYWAYYEIILKTQWFLWGV